MIKSSKFLSFLDSNWYIATISLIVLISWTFKADVVGYIIIFLIITFLLVTVESFNPLLVLFILGPLILQPLNPYIKASEVVGYYSLSLIGVIPAFFAFIFHVLYYKKKFVVGKYFFPLLAVSIAALLGGTFFYDIIKIKNVIWGFVFGVPFLLIYFLFRNYLDNEDNKLNLYFSKIIMFAGIVVIFQMIIFFINYDKGLMYALYAKQIKLGWGVTNMIASFFHIAIPITLYLATKSKKWFVYLFLVLIMSFFTLLTNSRGGVATLIFLFPFYLFATYYFTPKERKKTIIISYLSCFVVLIVFLVIFRENVFNMIEVLTSRGIKAPGRARLYPIGIDAFLKNPLFGAGFAYLGPFDGKSFQWYHQNFIQIIASTGIAGILAYGYQYVIKFKIILNNWSAFNIFVLLAFLGIEAYSLLDTATFVPSPFMIYLTLIIVVTEINNKSIKIKQSG